MAEKQLELGPFKNFITLSWQSGIIAIWHYYIWALLHLGIMTFGHYDIWAY
jgi:hypothetical protein